MPRAKPHRLGEFIGQPRLIGYLAHHVEAARRLGTSLLPMLILSRPGMGKSTLAKALSIELGVQFFDLVASPKTSREQLVTILAALNHADVLCLDECHRLPDPVQELLFRAIDDRKIPARAEDGRLDEVQSQSISEFSLVAATTDPDRLLRPFRSRLVPMQFDPYASEDLKAIAERVAHLHHYRITPQAARTLARMPGICTPRQIELYVEEMARLAAVGERELGKQHLQRLLCHKGIDRCGLEPYHRLYLLVLAESPQGSCSLTQLASRLGMSDRNLRHMVEPLLFEQRLVEIGSDRRRVLTPAGRQAAAQSPPSGGSATALAPD
jgi:Holliday junction DNA helicase RuvB